MDGGGYEGCERRGVRLTFSIKYSVRWALGCFSEFEDFAVVFRVVMLYPAHGAQCTS